MLTAKEFEVSGFVYTQDGKSHRYSTIVKATNSSAARSSGEASARREYGSDFKKCSLITHELK